MKRYNSTCTQKLQRAKVSCRDACPESSQTELTGPSRGHLCCCSLCFATVFCMLKTLLLCFFVLFSFILLVKLLQLFHSLHSLLTGYSLCSPTHTLWCAASNWILHSCWYLTKPGREENNILCHRHPFTCACCLFQCLDAVDLHSD